LDVIWRMVVAVVVEGKELYDGGEVKKRLEDY
jgi:hypothetical protein